MRIKRGVDPIGTEHYKTMMSGPAGLTAYYRVIDITGTPTHTPSGEEPIVWLQLNRKTPRPVDNHLCFPLSLFVSIFEQTSEADIFWEDETARA